MPPDDPKHFIKIKFEQSVLNILRKETKKYLDLSHTRADFIWGM
jgi:hypothetical protein